MRAGMLSNRDFMVSKRGSFNHSGLPMVSQNRGHQCKSGMVSTIQRPSEHWKRLASGVMRWWRSRLVGWRPSISVAERSVAMVQAAVPRRLASTTCPLPVRSASRRAAMIPRARASPAVWSTCAGRGMGATPPGSVIASVTAPRPKKAVTS